MPILTDDADALRSAKFYARFVCRQVYSNRDTCQVQMDAYPIGLGTTKDQAYKNLKSKDQFPPLPSDVGVLIAPITSSVRNMLYKLFESQQ